MQDANKQINEMRDLLSEKDRIIKSKAHPKQDFSIAVHASGTAQQLGAKDNSEFPTVRIEYLSAKNSRAKDSSQSLPEGMYVRKLEALVIRYEKALGYGQVAYAELQEKVYEYL